MKIRNFGVMNMVNEVKWTKYLWMSLLSFGAFMLEYFAIFVIEKMILGVDIWNYTPRQRGDHCIIMACLWVVVITCILIYSRRRWNFPTRSDYDERISSKGWLKALLALAGCKILTFIDWHSLKVVGEWQGKDLYWFFAQYAYYFFEVGLVLLIIVFGQKAIEALRKRESAIPYGGFILAATWGIFHFVSRGVGLEMWNGISTILFSLLSGLIYVQVKRNPFYSYIFIAAGYLL